TVRRCVRSAMSDEKSTSSTVQVFLMALLYISKNTGYFMGRRLRSKPLSKIIFYFSFSILPVVRHGEDWLLTGFAAFRVFERTRQLRFLIRPCRHRHRRLGNFCRRTRAEVIGCL